MMDCGVTKNTTTTRVEWKYQGHEANPEYVG